MYFVAIIQSHVLIQNMRKICDPCRIQTVELVLEAWRKLPDELIRKSFRSFALSGVLDRS